MQFDIENVVEENIRLKKSLQMTKINLEKLEKQFKELQCNNTEEVRRYQILNEQYCDLQKKIQNSYTENEKSNSSLVEQILELKDIVESKQRQLQQMQIKLIPNLDQDMLRVKLISEMEGPYQETVEKKDFQISQLKDKLNETTRKLQISELESASRLKAAKKELQEVKRHYESQNESLLEQLNLAVARNEAQSVQSGIIKRQKKEIDQLRANLQFMTQTHEQLQLQAGDIKRERNELLQKISHLNQNEALIIQHKNSRADLQNLKEQKIALENESLKLKVECEKLQRKLSSCDDEKRRLSNEFEKEINSLKMSHEMERLKANGEVNELKEEIRVLRANRSEQQLGNEHLHERIRSLEKQLQESIRQYEKLRSTTNIENSSGFWNIFKGVSKKEETENSTKNNIYNKHIHNNINNKETVIVNEKENDQKESNKDRESLKKENQKLKYKLREANEKIMQLLKDKVKMGNFSPQRDRAYSAVEKNVGVFLEYEDCSMKPLVQPTLYTYSRKHTTASGNRK